MPIVGQAIIVSSSNVYVANDRDTAIALAVSGAPGNKATVIPRYALWPQLIKYSNDNGLFPTINPRYIWDSTTSDGQSRGFAARSGGISNANPLTINVNLCVFSDNAHVARVDVYNFSPPTPVLVQTLTPPVLLDGNMDPIVGLIETPPYNWQDIRVYKNSSSNPLPPGAIYVVVVSFTAVNYILNPLGSENPAGLSFVANVDFIS